MKVEFIKDHPSGIKAGAKHDVADAHAQRWIEQGYAQAVTLDESVVPTDKKPKGKPKADKEQ